MRTIFLFSAIMISCSTTELKPVSKSRWVECWNLCGRKDNLTAASDTVCLCVGGHKIVRMPTLPVEEQKPWNPFEFLLGEPQR